MKRPHIHLSRRNLLRLLTAIALLVVLIIVLKCGKPSVQVSTKGTTVLTPTQIEQIRDIGEWEFLTVADEEMVDTTASGFLSDKQLIRLYYGTLRLGIDLQEAPDGWLRQKGDTIVATLPPIKLLDDDFIDEARTRSFYEDGSWRPADYAQLYGKAKRMMLGRCLTDDNYRAAEDAAVEAFGQMLRSMGFQLVKVSIQPHPKPKPSMWERITKKANSLSPSRK